jgi:hypothetical protein
MKAVGGALLATLVGLAMIAGGVYGIAKGGDDDKKDKTPSPSSTFSFTPPAVATAPSEPQILQCSDVADRDPRLAHLDQVDLEPVGRATGSAEIDEICNGDTVVLTVRIKGIREEETASYNAWLYRSRKRAEQVGTMIATGGAAFGSVTISPGVRTTKYDELVISRVRFGQTEDRPGKIVFRGSL